MGILTLLCLALSPATLLAATLTATLDRDTVSVGESATLTLVFEGGSPKNPPALPRLQNLRTTYGGQSSQFSWVNGKSTSSVTHTYALTPTQPGDYTIPPIQAEVDGKILTSPAILLKAARAAAAQPDAAGADNQLALLKLVLPKKQVYIGEIVPIEVQLYVRDVVQNVQQFQMSPFNADGFAFGKTVQGGQRQARIGNANFSVVPFQTTVTAVKTGTLKIEPVDFSMVVLLPAAGQRQRDPFDPFGMFQPRGEQRRVTLSTEAETVEVLPLPDGAPAGFGGAVGSFSMAMTAAPTDVAAGDPITVKAQITGRGALDAVTLPVPAAWQDFKTYPPSSKVQTTDQLGLQGVKHFEIVVVPQNAEVKQLPPLAFSFFDPEAKTYRTLTQPAVALKVRPGAASASGALAGSKTEPPPTQDIVPIKLRAGRATDLGRPLVARPGFWALQSLPVLAWAALLVRRRRAESLANNPRLRRQRQVAQFVEQGLVGLNRLAQENNSADFFALVFRLLQEQLGERLDLPASSITEAVIEERLQHRRLPAPMLARLHELFQACNLARYAPVRSSQELEAFIPRLETALREIREIKS